MSDKPPIQQMCPQLCHSDSSLDQACPGGKSSKELHRAEETLSEQLSQGIGELMKEMIPLANGTSKRDFLVQQALPGVAKIAQKQLSISSELKASDAITAAAATIQKHPQLAQEAEKQIIEARQTTPKPTKLPTGTPKPTKLPTGTPIKKAKVTKAKAPVTKKPHPKAKPKIPAGPTGLGSPLTTSTVTRPGSAFGVVAGSKHQPTKHLGAVPRGVIFLVLVVISVSAILFVYCLVRMHEKHGTASVGNSFGYSKVDSSMNSSKEDYQEDTVEENILSVDALEPEELSRTAVHASLHETLIRQQEDRKMS